MIRISHLLPLIALLWSAFAMAEDNAGIFFYGAPPSPDAIARLAESKTVTSFLTDLDRTTTCYGSIILPSYDRGGKAAGFLKAAT